MALFVTKPLESRKHKTKEWFLQLQALLFVAWKIKARFCRFQVFVLRCLWSTLGFVLTPYIICEQRNFCGNTCSVIILDQGIVPVLHKILVFGLSTCLSMQRMHHDVTPSAVVGVYTAHEERTVDLRAWSHGAARCPCAQGHAEYPGYPILCFLKSISLFSVGGWPILLCSAVGKSIIHHWR